MKTKQVKLEENTEQRKQHRTQRQIRIAQDKERARQWAEQRRLRQVPVAVASEVTTVQSISEGSGHQQTAKILLQLEKRKEELTHELAEINTAIRVIKRTLSRN